MNRTKVFLDSNILIGASNPQSREFLFRLKHLVNVGLVAVITTDLTCQEIAKKSTEKDYGVIKNVGRPHFRKIIKRVLGTELPEITKAELKAKIVKSYERSIKTMFKELNCKILAIDEVKPSIVFSHYTAGEGFFTGQGKKDQFPDAFIFERLKAEVSSNEQMIIVSNDKDFEKPVKAENHISLVKTLPELFEKLGLKVEEPNIEDFLEINDAELFEAVTYELDCWGLVGDVPDSEIERTIVTGVKAMELASFGSTEEGGSILVVGRLSVDVRISYTHPDWERAMNYSEYKNFPTSNVTGETEVNFDVDVSMPLAVDKDGNPKNIEEVVFLSGDFQHVELYQHGFYRWWRKKAYDL